MSVHPLALMPTQPRPRGITRLTVPVPGSAPPAHPKTNPPRWKTREFVVYYVVAAVVLPVMVWVPVRLSSWQHPNAALFASRLSPGWIFGRPIDNSDSQYRSFRNNLPILSLLALSFLLFKRISTFLFPPSSSPNSIPLTPIPPPPFPHSTPTPSPPPNATPPSTTPTLTFALLLLLALHGSSALKILLILALNFAIAASTPPPPSRLAPLLTWVFNAAVLFANEWYGGYRFGAAVEALGFLDAYKGFYPRWHISFNITMLRLVSFNMDYHWARTRTPHPASSDIYLVYTLYPPLYIAGPIITFNDFTWQLRHPKKTPPPALLSYALRFAAALLTMELVLHFMHVGALKSAKAWAGDGPLELAMVGFWNLVVVWMKLLLPWRFFRLWALLDGIDPPENMVRCMANNYSPLGFWRAWHRSYNLWIIRYIYIPLGGTKNLAGTAFLIFSFVALWHDLSFRLLAWGWLVSLFILPELGARYVLPASKYGDRPWYRHACALGAVVNMLAMMAANLVGFVIGTDGMVYFIQQVVGTWEGIRFLFAACLCMFVGAQLMFEYREEEMRQGIYRRC